MKVVRHPATIVRSICVTEISPGQWEGRFHDAGKLVFRTEVGAKWLVLDALRYQNKLHLGLPIVVVPLRGKKRAGGRAA